LNLGGSLYLKNSEFQLSGGAQFSTSSYNPLIVNSLSISTSGGTNTNMTLAADFSSLPSDFALRSGTNLSTVTLVE